MDRDFDSALVVGDSVADGGGDDEGGWPRRLERRLSVPVRVDARTARTAVHVRDHLAEILATAGERPLVLVHVGHNDPQDGGGGDGPRVSLNDFAEAARAVDRELAADPTVAGHAFVAPVPLASLSRPDAVPVSERAADRSREYRERLRATVEPHVALAFGDWTEYTADGVHPTPSGHAAVADRVAAWVRG